MSNKEVFRIIREVDSAVKDYPNLFNFLKKLPRRTWADIVLDFADKHAAAEILGEVREGHSVSHGTSGTPSAGSLREDSIPVLSEVIGGPSTQSDFSPIGDLFVAAEENLSESNEPILGLEEDEDDIEKILRESLEAVASPGEVMPSGLRLARESKKPVLPEVVVKPAKEKESRAQENFVPEAPVVKEQPVEFGSESTPNKVLADFKPGGEQSKGEGQKKGKRRFNLDQLMG